MAGAKPDLFTITFWQTTIARIVHYAAIGALGSWTIGTTPAADVPSWGVAMAAGVGALYALLTSFAAGYIPPSAARPLAALYPAMNQQLEVRVRRRTHGRGPQRRPPPVAPTTADLKKPVPEQGG